MNYEASDYALFFSHHPVMSAYVILLLLQNSKLYSLGLDPFILSQLQLQQWIQGWWVAQSV